MPKSEEAIEDESEESNEENEDEMKPNGSSTSAEPATSDNDHLLDAPDELISYFKRLGGIRGDVGEKPLVVGMVGYPNVGKSSTINRMVGRKRVSVSATPGKTKKLQTIPVDNHVGEDFEVYV